jgi:hypothetical protein
MKVKELIEKLQKFDPELEVVCGEYDSFDDPSKGIPEPREGWSGKNHDWWFIDEEPGHETNPEYVKAHYNKSVIL